jgi:hypothetical protein
MSEFQKTKPTAIFRIISQFQQQNYGISANKINTPLVQLNAVEG